MRKTICLLSIFILLSALILSGCSNIKKDSIVCTSLVKYNLQGISDFGFNVNLITTDKNIEVEFVRFSGENTQGLSVRLVDDTYDSLREIKQQGYYIRLLGFVCYTEDKKVIIESVTLKIDGEEKEYSFSTPIKHYVTQDHDLSVQARSYPLFISTNSYQTTEYFFDYHVDAEVIITDFSFNDFLIVKNAEILINGQDQGRLQDLLPLTIPQDSDISIKCYLGFKNGISSTNFDSIYCDSLLSYIVKDTAEIEQVANNLVSQSVSKDADAIAVITMMID